jgi:hypothetical protein
VGPCIFGIRDQPIDRPPLDLVGRPRPLIYVAISRAGARAEGGEVLALLPRRKVLLRLLPRRTSLSSRRHVQRH